MYRLPDSYNSFKIEVWMLDLCADDAVSVVAAALGEPARARIIFCLRDGHARTSTELAMVAGISPSTASVHLNRLTTVGLVKVLAQGKHRFYSLGGADVANALEGLSVDRWTLPRQVCAAHAKPTARRPDLLRSPGGHTWCTVARPLQGAGMDFGRTKGQSHGVRC